MTFETYRLGHLGTFSQSGIDKKSNEDELPVKIVNYMDVYGNKKSIIRGNAFQEVTAPKTKFPFHLLCKGDVLITPSSETSDDIGHSAVVLDDIEQTSYSYHLVRFRPFKTTRIIPEFSGFAFQARQVRAHLEKMSKGTTRKILTRNDFTTIPFTLPDLATQRQIADFLDRETARIDLLIEKKQKLVALLGEKARSVNELFFINTHKTNTQPLHRLYRVVTGKTPSRDEEDNFSLDEGLPWATPVNLGFLSPVETTKEYLSAKGSEGQPVVDAGTVLLNGIGASVGKIGIAGTKLSFNQQIHALIAKKRVLADRFLFFQLLTLKEQLVLLANSTTLPILNAERLGRLELKIFDFNEQDLHCANMDALLQNEAITAQKINASIDRLKEYRSTLITAAVTGQIDVTTYAESGAAERRLDAVEEVCE